jgi:hypothetical protein
MSQPEGEYMNWERTSRISLPSEAVDEYMIVPVSEFRRLRERIEEEQATRHDNIPGWYFALFGAAVADGAAIPSLFAADGLPDWVIPTFIVSAASFLLVGVVLVLIARTLNAEKKKTTSEIVQDMRNIEAMYIGRKAEARNARSGPNGVD